MYLIHWKFEISQDKRGIDAGRWFVRELFINKGTFGGNVVIKNIFSAATKQECLKFCDDHKIRI